MSHKNRFHRIFNKVKRLETYLEDINLAKEELIDAKNALSEQYFSHKNHLDQLREITLEQSAKVHDLQENLVKPIESCKEANRKQHTLTFQLGKKDRLKMTKLRDGIWQLIQLTNLIVDINCPDDTFACYFYQDKKTFNRLELQRKDYDQEKIPEVFWKELQLVDQINKDV